MLSLVPCGCLVGVSLISAHLLSDLCCISPLTVLYLVVVPDLVVLPDLVTAMILCHAVPCSSRCGLGADVEGSSVAVISQCSGGADAELMAVGGSCLTTEHQHNKERSTWGRGAIHRGCGETSTPSRSRGSSARATSIEGCGRGCRTRCTRIYSGLLDPLIVTLLLRKAGPNYFVQ